MIFHISWLYRISFTYNPTASFSRHRIVEWPWIEFKMRTMLFKISWNLSQSNVAAHPVKLACFNSINGFEKTTWTAMELMWFQIKLMGFNPLWKNWKIIEYLKRKLLPRGILFLSETYSTEYNYASWRKEFNADLFFSCRLSNSCGVLISTLGKYDVKVLNQMSENKGF